MSAESQAKPPAVKPLPLPVTELGAGDRFPNFLLADQEGKSRWFLERAKGNLLLILVDLSDDALQGFVAAGAQCAAAGVDRLAIIGGTEADVAAKAKALAADFPLLSDGNGKIREALHRMTGIATPFVVALDANQRVISLMQQGDPVAWALARLSALEPAPPAVRIEQSAPVLIVPNVLSPDLCRSLIARWELMGHDEGAVHSIVDGNEVTRTYHSMKKRRDHRIEDESVLKPLMAVIGRRLAPELDKAFSFQRFKFDRFVITCYDAERGDFFKRHRDNQSPSTADRRFALTLNLNTPEYEGGELVFPEYGSQRYCPPAGGAILFSCSLLHEALPVTKGRRFTLLSFLRQ